MSREKILHGITIKQHTGCGSMYITINHIEVINNVNGENKKIYVPKEVFITLGKSGACMHSQNESMGKMITLALSENVSIDKIIQNLRGIRCPTPSLKDGEQINSCSDAIAVALENWKIEVEKLN